MTLTRKQQQILDAIVFLQSRGESPTVREIAQLVGLNAPATVHKHLQALEEAGIIERSGKSRGIRLLRGTGIPIVGKIAAGQPIENYDPDREEVDPLLPGSRRFPELEVDARVFSRGGAHEETSIGAFEGTSTGALVALEVQGESMIEAGILPGDYVIIRRQPTVEEGEIAAVSVDGAGTLKRWSLGASTGSSRSGASGSGRRGKKRITLSPANARFEPIVFEEGRDDADVRVFGKYLGLIRLGSRVSS